MILDYRANLSKTKMDNCFVWRKKECGKMVESVWITVKYFQTLFVLYNHSFLSWYIHMVPNTETFKKSPNNVQQQEEQKFVKYQLCLYRFKWLSWLMPCILVQGTRSSFLLNWYEFKVWFSKLPVFK